MKGFAYVMLMTEWQLLIQKALPWKNGTKTRKNGSISARFSAFQNVSMWFQHVSRLSCRPLAATGAKTRRRSFTE